MSEPEAVHFVQFNTHLMQLFFSKLTRLGNNVTIYKMAREGKAARCVDMSPMIKDGFNISSHFQTVFFNKISSNIGNFQKFWRSRVVIHPNFFFLERIKKKRKKAISDTPGVSEWWHASGYQAINNNRGEKT